MVDESRALTRHPPEVLPSGGTPVANFRKDAPVQTLLGVEQKAWFLDQLRLEQLVVEGDPDLAL